MIKKVKEKVKTLFGYELYPSQLNAINEMLDGNIINMETGEGKTIVIICTAIMKALRGEQVVVITPNEYLNERDFNDFKKMADEFNLTYSLNGEHTEKDINTKNKIYDVDIVYSTMAEFTFDYLRGIDMDKSFNQKLFKKRIIIDEIDQILVDRSGTSYGISHGESEDLLQDDIALYSFANRICSNLIGGEITVILQNEDIEDGDFDFIFHRIQKYVYLTERGENKIKNLMKIDLNSNFDIDFFSALHNTLRAKYLLEKGIDYIVNSKGELSTIDINNGRFSQNSKFETGINLALELKEGLELTHIPQGERRINGLYHISRFEGTVGCSGTAFECKSLFRDLLNTNTVAVSRNKPKMVTIHKSKYFKTKDEKYAEVLELIHELYDNGIPMLVATENDNICKEFHEYIDGNFKNINVLINDTLDNEVEIITKSGKGHNILLSTLISGRGTDIKVENLINEKGGLQVIFLNRFRNIRAELQIIGRTGRQGSKGSIWTFGSLDDNIFKSISLNSLSKVNKYINNKQYHKIDKMIVKLQTSYKNSLFEVIKDNYYKNHLELIFTNYLKIKYNIENEDLMMDINDYMKVFRINDKRGISDCILKTKVYIDNLLKKENNKKEDKP